jgi:hypothetical protein
MNKKQVIELIGKDNWKEFCKWMAGQTVGIDDNGEMNYYDWDVERFKSLLDRRRI